MYEKCEFCYANRKFKNKGKNWCLWDSERFVDYYQLNIEY